MKKSLLISFAAALVVFATVALAGVAPDPVLGILGGAAAMAGVLANQGQASTVVKLLDPASAANTAAATSAWIDARAAEGDIVFTNHVGALTGSITWTVEHASDGAGTGATGITPNEGAYSAGAANQVQKRTVSANAIQGWVRCVGTIVTGPALVAVSIQYHPKYT